MPSKFDLLREGKAIEFEPGVTGRLNPKKKTLELSTGEVLNAANDPDFFPQNEKGLQLSRQKEFVEKEAKGPAGEFLHQYSGQGIPGGIGDWRAYLTQTGDEYATRKAAEQQVSQRISKESPYISGAATGANIATDIALTRGMSAFKAAPLLTVGSAGSRIVTEPQEVLGEAALAAGGGAILDKGAGWLSNVAKRRTASRALPGQQQAANEANVLQNQEFNALKQNVKNVNDAKLKQHQIDLNTRQNQIIQEQNAFEKKKLARDNEIVKLKNKAEMDKMQHNANAAKSDAEYKAAKKAAEQENKMMDEKFKSDQTNYEKSLKELPQLQKKAQAEYSENVVKNAQVIEKNFPKSAKISSDELRVSEFIDESINKSGIGGSRQASQSKRILQSIFPEGELIGGRELSKRYKALEDAIQRSEPEVQNILNQFKNHLGDRLPVIVQDTVAFSKISPLMKRSLDSDIRSIINELGIEGKNLEKTKNNLINTAIANGRNALREELNPSNFIERIQNGELSREISNKILSSEHFLFDISPEKIPSLKKAGLLQALSDEARRKHSYFVQELSNKLQNKLAKYEIKAVQSAENVSKKLRQDVKKTYGLAEPVARPNPPMPASPLPIPQPPPELPSIAPIAMPPHVSPPVVPPLPPKPALMPEPIAANPIPNPILAPAQGMAERTGDLLETPIFQSGRSLKTQFNNLSRLAGLHLIGKAALPAEVGYLGLKGLTSPTAMGEAARMTFKQGGIQAIESWARKYPSYHDGILENPQERRSLTKEIEDASDMPIEQKAVIQSKINRGKPIQDSL